MKTIFRMLVARDEQAFAELDGSSVKNVTKFFARAEINSVLFGVVGIAPLLIVGLLESLGLQRNLAFWMLAVPALVWLIVCLGVMLFGRTKLIRHWLGLEHG